MTITTTDPKIDVKALSAVLAKIGLALPEQATTPVAAVKVSDPSDSELAAAIQAATNPVTDKRVRDLLTARQIARAGVEKHTQRAAWGAQRQALRDSLDTLNEQIHAVFDKAATELHDVAPKLRAYESLDNLTISALPARELEPARRAIDAQHTLRAALDAWTKLWITVGRQQTGRANTIILQACNPDPDAWFEHSSRQPNTLPAPGDVWGVVRTGWTLDLAHDLRDAKNRDQRIRDAINSGINARQLAKGRSSSWGMIGAAR